MSTTTTHENDPQAAPQLPPGNGRDAAGRFTAGNKYGPGNPFARQTAQLRKALLEVVTPEELRQVVFTLLLLAKAGKLEATKLLFQYVLGKPAEGVDPDRLEVEEWKLSQESKVNPVAVHETVNHLPAEAANVLVRHTWPASAETNYLSAVREELEAMDTEDAERARAAQEAPAEANGENGAGSAPHPRPPSHEGSGEPEARGEAAARGGRPAKPQAAGAQAERAGARGPAGAAPKATGFNGDAGGPCRGGTANGAQTPPPRAETNGRDGRPRKKPPRR